MLKLMLSIAIPKMTRCIKIMAYIYIYILLNSNSKFCEDLKIIINPKAILLFCKNHELSITRILEPV
jgi:hypothetical protein